MKLENQRCTRRGSSPCVPYTVLRQCPKVNDHDCDHDCDAWHTRKGDVKGFFLERSASTECKEGNVCETQHSYSAV